jgi:Na+/H+ antiporter NhaD/arsenite permease-like protein
MSIPLAAISTAVLQEAEGIELAVTALDLTGHWTGFLAIVAFLGAYAAVVFEERLHLRKSIPVMLGAGVIWALIGIGYMVNGDTVTAAEGLRHSLGEFAELFLFILAAMTFVATMEERQVFDGLRAWLISKGLSMRKLFWVTGTFAFCLSSQLDNLTTALVMGAVCLTVGKGNPRFLALACINTVVAANAGGAWSAFGDITTLMVWQAGRAEFFDFYRLILPSLVNWLIPAVILSFAVPDVTPERIDERVVLRRGAKGVIALFAFTIVMAVSSYNILGLPPVIGMTTGLALLKFYGYYLRRTSPALREDRFGIDSEPLAGVEEPAQDHFDIFDILRRAEWDTLMFFFGIIVAVGGLATIGYLARLSEILYVGFGTTPANVAVGIISAIVDNIPVMFAVLNMNPPMDLFQWLLVTLTAGTGGSLLSVGSAAGVALMGLAGGQYTFCSHLKWTWAIALGYIGSIWVHFLVNG